MPARMMINLAVNQYLSVVKIFQELKTALSVDGSLKFLNLSHLARKIKKNALVSTCSHKNK